MRHSRNKTSYQSKFRRLWLALERLEQRELMAADFADSFSSKLGEHSSIDKLIDSIEEQLVVATPTHSYIADDGPVSLVIHPAKIALQLKDGVESTAIEAMGLEFERGIGSEFGVYVAASGAVDNDALMASGLVQASTAVFFAQATQSEAVLLDELIVALKPGVTAEAYFKNNPDFVSYEPLRGTADQFVAKVKAGIGAASLEVANKIDDDSRIQFVSPNFYQNWQKYYTPNDPRIANQWHLNNTGQGGGLVDADADVFEAWDVIQGGSSSMVIGIVDDGIAAHPDLKLWTNTAEGDGLAGVDDDGNGWVDDFNGWNFVSNNNSSGTPSVDDMHGTSVSGVAAAIGDNSLGVAGASYKSSVLSAKIFQGASVASDANIAGALYYAAGRTANGLGTWKASDIVNNSWGGGANSTAINAALTWGTTNGRLGKGTPILFATGNDFGAVSQPALQSLNIPGVFAVGATNNKGTRSDYSNFGAAVDLVAPSNDTRVGYLAIDTTDRVGADGYATGDYTGTGSATGFGGTSSATPLATGITALVMAQAEAVGIVLTPAQLRSYIRTNTDLIAGAYDTTTGKNLEYGFGRINAFSAVSNLGKPEISVVTSTTELQSGGSVTVGSAYVDEFVDTTIRIRNQGSQPLVLSSVNMGSGPFTLLTALGATTLGIGEATTFTVRFAPTAGGVANQTISIGSNDNSESSFSLVLSGTGIQPTFSGAVFEDWDGDNTKDAIDTSLVGNVIYIDANNNGSLDTTPNTFTNTTSVAILDTSVVTSTLNVAGLASPIFDVNVKVNLNHTFLSDLRVTLISPSGAQVILANQIGGSGDNFVNTVFDDEASVAIASGTAPFTGSFRPSQPLSGFDNLTGNGTWTLQIEDLAGGDTGTLLNWELTISTSEQFGTVRANGQFGIVGAPVGTHVVRSQSPAGWSTGPTYTMTVASPTDSFRNLDFGIAKNNRFYAQVFDDIDADGIWDATEVSATGRSLVDDANNNGILDNTTITFANSTPVPIVDLATRTSVISASGLAGVITDVNVRVNLTHTFDGDLDVFLIAPDGTRVELFTDVGGSGDNFVNTILDSQAATAITAGTAPFTGTFRPEGNLNTLNGKAGNGNWTLEVTDDAGGDVGTINDWSVTITTGEVATAVPSTGLLPLDLTAGSHNVLLVSQAGWRYTLPTTGVHVVTAAGAPLQDKRFGTRLNNVAPTVNVNNSTVSVSEGATVVNSGTWSDPNPTDPISFSASIGTVTFSSGTWSWSLPTTDDTASTLVTITANDGEGGITNATFTYAVTNANPLITVNNASVSTAVPGVVTNSGTWSDVPADTVTLTASLGTVVKNANGTWDWSINTTAPVSNQSVTITANDEDGGSAFVTFAYSATTTITNTKAYYKGSFYSAGGANVGAALDTSKSLLQAGSNPVAASFANVTNYSRGINGVVLDILGLSATTLTASDFTFKMSPQGAFNEAANPPSSWSNAPTPTSITVSSGTPAAGTSRVRIEWPDNLIQDRWLQIRVLANTSTGLQSPATYYLGNLRGDIDGVLTGGLLVLQNADLTAALPVGGLGSVSNIRDVDKNGFILNSDFVIIRNGINAGLTLRVITIPAAGSPAEAFSPGDNKLGGNKLGGDQKGGGITTFNSPSIGSGTMATVARDSSTSSPVLGSTITVGLLNTTSSAGNTLDLITSSVETKPVSTEQPVTSSLNKKAKALDQFFEQLGNQL